MSGIICNLIRHSTCWDKKNPNMNRQHPGVPQTIIRIFVIPAKAGIHKYLGAMPSRSVDMFNRLIKNLAFSLEASWRKL